MDNNIEYDMNSCPVINNIVNYTGVKLIILKIATAHRKDVGIDDNYVTQLY